MSACSPLRAGRRWPGTSTAAARVVFDADRAADIRQVIRFAQREKLHVAIRGGAEAWRVAPELAAAEIPVMLDPLDDLPESFDTVGATLENAARLNRAGVKIAFSFNDPEPHNIRQAAPGGGHRRGHGLPYEAAARGPHPKPGRDLRGRGRERLARARAHPRTWCSGAAIRWR